MSYMKRYYEDLTDGRMDIDMDTVEAPKKRRGRQPGSKNRPKPQSQFVPLLARVMRNGSPDLEIFAGLERAQQITILQVLRHREDVA